MFLRLLKGRPLFAILAAGVPLIEFLARQSGGPGPSIAIVRNPFAAIAAATVFCRYIICDRRGLSRNWVIYALPIAMIAGAWMTPSGEPRAVQTMHIMFAVGVLGAAAFVVAAAKSKTRAAKADYLSRLIDALLVPVAASMLSFGLSATSRVNPVYDARIFAFEEILGPQFSLIGVRSYALLAPLSRVATACYDMVAFCLVLVAAAQATLKREREVLDAAVLAGAIGFALYFVCPVVGPLQAFPSIYPEALPPVPVGAPLLTVAVGPPRNGMPSLHTVWALLIWFNARPLRSSLRTAVRISAVMTLWAAIGLEDTHWVTDMVVGVPLAVAIQSAAVAAEDGRRRWSDVIVCALITGAWLIGFRLSTPILRLPMPIAWAAVIATTCWPLWRQHLQSPKTSLSDRFSPHRDMLARQLPWSQA